jgi:hypothetical protein
MFNLVMEELRHIRKRLDAHIDDETHLIQNIERSLGQIREEMASHKVKLTGIMTGIAVVVSAVVGWIFNQFGK